jgi:CBS-domain-containing membrane protein
VIGSQVIGSFLGVLLRELLVDVPTCGDACRPFAAALAVSLTIFLTAYLNLIHPPSGATAVVAVYSGKLELSFDCY